MSILKSGPQPCIVHGDESLITLGIVNGLRNAIEATVAAGDDFSRTPVTVMWGTTDLDQWVSIVDVGIGFKGNIQRAFEIGATTKSGPPRDGSRYCKSVCLVNEREGHADTQRARCPF